MELIIEELFDVFGSFLMQGVMAFFGIFFPKRELSKKCEKILHTVCIVVSMLLLTGLIVGIVIACETGGQSFWGWFLIGLSVAFFVLGIAFRVILRIKNKGAESNGRKNYEK